MRVISFCFCKDQQGRFGLVKSFAHGYLTVVFDDGEREMKPSELTFL